MSAARSRALLVLLAALLALAGTVAVRPPHAPPLYDGLGFPDEPYRWVVPPAGAPATRAWTPATATAHVVDGTVDGTQAFSAEQGPQVAFQTQQGSLSVPAGVTAVTITATGIRPPPVPPADGTIVSNVYSFTASLTGGTGVPTLKPGTSVIVNLRADKAQPRAKVVVVEQWDGRAWSQVRTDQVGLDVYAAGLPALRPVAVVRLADGRSATATTPPAGGAAPGAAASRATPAPGPDGGSALLVLVIAGAVVLLVVGGLVTLRLTGRRVDPGS